MPPPDPPGTTRVLPMLLRIGDRLTDETGEYVIASRPTPRMPGKTSTHAVKRIDNVEITMIRNVGRARADQREACRGGQG
jgi:hypothetical protein